MVNSLYTPIYKSIFLNESVLLFKFCWNFFSWIQSTICHPFTTKPFTEPVFSAMNELIIQYMSPDLDELNKSMALNKPQTLV